MAGDRSEGLPGLTPGKRDMPALQTMVRHRRQPTLANAQRGSFLLEALVSVLIVALGILGLIGLQARAIQNVDDAQYRGEAAYVANELLGQMWLYDRAKLIADFDSSGAGPAYTEFKTWVGQRLPGANIPANAPVVTVTQPGTTTPTSTAVYIRIMWQAPGEPAGTPVHFYEIDAIVGANPP
jgi:type IV pilus assembly protein PilV